MIVRFDDQNADLVARRIAALPDVSSYALRLELTNVGVGAGDRRRHDAVVEVVSPTRRSGYAIVAGRDLSPRGPDVLVERAFADAWGLRVGSTLFVSGLGPETVAGLVEAPDNVGYPLAKPRIYLSRPALDATLGPEPHPRVDLAEIWLRDSRYLDQVLVQARATSFGLRDVRFATRSGVRVACRSSKRCGRS
jgi:hypothetical protein